MGRPAHERCRYRAAQPTPRTNGVRLGGAENTGDGQWLTQPKKEDEYNPPAPPCSRLIAVFRPPPPPTGGPGARVVGRPSDPPPVLAQDTPIAMGMVNEMISSIQGGAPPLSTRCYTSFWAWTRAFPYAPSPQSCAEETGGIRLPPFFWLDWQHFRGASCVRCPPQLVPSTGGGVFLRFPHAWDDPRLGACAHERAVTYLRMPRLLCPLASPRSRVAPPR